MAILTNLTILVNILTILVTIQTHQVTTLKSMLTIGDPTGSYMTIENHIGPNGTAWDPMATDGTIWYHN